MPAAAGLDLGLGLGRSHLAMDILRKCVLIRWAKSFGTATVQRRTYFVVRVAYNRQN